ncbi:MULTISPECIES: hypothetical protein [Ensifer]|jgi:hypothetical protein|uniref:Acyloxyacyl hydrolase n=1 Tax=Ensifer canadensis TaxID=555315 RepID=A0AAW4FLP6_9HYPH|nr:MULTISPECIES: hypothetical protein [Ensifer]MDP9633738.1 hypothetical protein [Ensifer adhaerens]KQU93642.1 hypothetical protein ASD00_23465 [Ensifer sp. Root31]KQW58632.1 hypothetical protein ASD02_06485 [Ensifer sp. Root1252]KQW74337.1 hypothetical protein ASD03_07145 [Ensifer sp. Root127]KRC67467.1 hypothetical protein ASE32_09945 [Ensifer sp. Root231]
MKASTAIPLALLLGAATMPFLGTTDAQAQNRDVDQSVFAFGGTMVDADMFQSANPFGVKYADLPIVGLGYQYFPVRMGSFRFGLEAGLAGRFGGHPNAEFWGGVVGRYDGFEIGDAVRISPALTFGISYVTHAQEGRERQNELERNGNARTLFYLGPELNLSFETMPDVDFFWRVHHRSGAWGTLGDMHGGSNANVLGVRFNF